MRVAHRQLGAGLQRHGLVGRTAGALAAYLSVDGLGALVSQMVVTPVVTQAA